MVFASAGLMIPEMAVARSPQKTRSVSLVGQAPDVPDLRSSIP